jgi:hypothetical protein
MTKLESVLHQPSFSVSDGAGSLNLSEGEVQALSEAMHILDMHGVVMLMAHILASACGQVRFREKLFDSNGQLLSSSELKAAVGPITDFYFMAILARDRGSEDVVLQEESLSKEGGNSTPPELSEGHYQ